MSKPTRRRSRSGIELPEQSFGIAFGVGAVFSCLIISGFWLLWNSPCSFIGKRWRNTGCVATLDNAGSDVFFLNGNDNDGERWLYGVDQFVIHEAYNFDEESSVDRVLYTHTGKIEKLRLAENQTRFASTTLDGAGNRTLWVWEMADQSVLWQMDLRADQVLVSIAPDGSELVLTAGDQRQVWDVGLQEPFADLSAWAVAYTPDEESVITTSEEGVMRLDRAFENEQLVLKGEGIDYSCPIMSDTYLVLGDIRSAVVLDRESNRAVLELPDEGQLHNCVYNFAPDGTTFMINQFTAGRSDSVVRFYDVPSGNVTKEISVPYAFPLALDLSSDGRFLAIGGASIIYLIDLDSVE